ncbi:hypothetical protein [Chromobacterium haemolyticum]|uniref:Uncharacterized protein n=1 Tax=Chromobacterium haemolyticum TaxID=394935 RepID=A0A1W0D5I6_9NEIS|nr:hypothetical protein [Chromobacterium haemolyticum]OQS42287.1 hypothetical protein B0T45_05700 [Chromobacterium haemolyticum]
MSHLIEAPDTGAALAGLTEAEKWAVHIPGPDDLYAAPSHAAAVFVAEHHNKTTLPAIQKIMDSKPPEERRMYPPIECITAEVVPWPWDAAEHEESLSDDWPEFLEEHGLTVDGVAYASRNATTKDMFDGGESAGPDPS